MWLIGLAQKGNYTAREQVDFHYVFQSSITFESLSRLTAVRKGQSNGRNRVPKALIMYQMMLVNTTQSYFASYNQSYRAVEGDLLIQKTHEFHLFFNSVGGYHTIGTIKCQNCGQGSALAATNDSIIISPTGESHKVTSI